MRVHGFAPIIDASSEVLVLGTAPGIQSLVKEEYYAHGGNRFWNLPSTIFNQPTRIEYDSKKQMLLRNKIALWDVIKECDRKSAADKDIRNEVANDFNHLLVAYPTIRRIVFNGHKPEYYFGIHVNLKMPMQLLVAKSTSPANRRNYSFVELVEIWTPLLKTS